jgi:NADPH:quinone reductase-like Zn-dependent oxidoreductase
MLPAAHAPTVQNMTENMQAAAITAFGEPLTVRTLPRPVAARGEVLVRVVVAAVNPADVGMVAGRYRWADPARFPLVPGYDVAGTVEGSGERVVGFTAHKRLQRGGYAEFVALPADLLAPVPDGLDLADAATLPLAGLTALQALDTLGAVETLLVNGPRGAIGGFAADLARHRGITVVPPGHGAPVDAALDVIGGAPARDAFARVRDGGRYVTVVPEFWVAGGPFSTERGITPEVIAVRQEAGRLTDLVALAASGALVTRVGKILPLVDAGEAHRIVGRTQGAPHVTGKILLSTAPA